MSIVGQLADASVSVVEVSAAGLSMHARIRRLTSGELLEAGAGGLVMPEDGTRKPKAKNAGVSALVDGARFQELVVGLGVLALGDSPATLEPVTILASDDAKERRGTARLQSYALPPEIVAGLANEVLALTSGEGWRQRVASFLGSGPAAGRGDGAEVARVANGVP